MIFDAEYIQLLDLADKNDDKDSCNGNGRTDTRKVPNMAQLTSTGSATTYATTSSWGEVKRKRINQPLFSHDHSV